MKDPNGGGLRILVNAATVVIGGAAAGKRGDAKG